MSYRAKHIIYVMVVIFLAIFIAGLISEFIVSDFNLTVDGIMSSLILIIIGSFALGIGILFLMRPLKEWALFSILFFFAIMTGQLVVKIFTEPDFRMEFFLITIVSAILAVTMHFISVKIGAYDAINEANLEAK